MKQNSQWLSHVRTRSNTALDTSTPSDSPAAFSIEKENFEPTAADVEVDLGVVGSQLPLDDVAGRDAVDAEDLVADRHAGFSGRGGGAHRHDHGRERPLAASRGRGKVGGWSSHGIPVSQATCGCLGRFEGT